MLAYKSALLLALRDDKALLNQGAEVQVFQVPRTGVDVVRRDKRCELRRRFQIQRRVRHETVGTVGLRLGSARLAEQGGDQQTRREGVSGAVGVDPGIRGQLDHAKLG